MDGYKNLVTWLLTCGCWSHCLPTNLSVAVGNGIINADGHLWKVQRNAGLRFFNSSNLKLFIDQVLPPYLLNTEQRLEKAVKSENQREDLQDVFLELTTLLMGKMAYDVCAVISKKDRQLLVLLQLQGLTLPHVFPIL